MITLDYDIIEDYKKRVEEAFKAHEEHLANRKKSIEQQETIHNCYTHLKQYVGFTHVYDYCEQCDRKFYK